MYYQYFGLTEAPFSIAVNPRYLFMSPRHRDALAHLLYGVGAGGGFILLTGEVGTGKTTINRCLLEQLPQNTDIAMILNPALNAIELLASACDELGISYDENNHTLKTLTDKLHSYLLENHARGRKTVLLIDEAQHLDFDVLEQIRLLTNLETHDEKLLQIILIGQPELAQMLARPELRQLNQRITARYNLEPLNLDETAAYIQHRLQVAGMTAERVLFSPSLVRGIHKATRGIPRVINVLCDRMLLGAYGRNKSRADATMLNLAVREVLGEEDSGRRTWLWATLLATVLLLALAGWWFFNHSADTLLPGAPSVDVTEPVASASPAPGSAEAIPPAPDAAPEREQSDAAMEASARHAAESVMTPAAAAQAATVAIESAMLSPGTAMEQLWALSSAEPVPQTPCLMDVQHGIACFEGEVWTWDDLAAFDRPVSLEMITAERFSAEVLLLGIEGSQAWVLTDGGVAKVRLADLAPYWTGHYRFLWHPPEGFDISLALGEDSEVVTAVAQLFARLDGQQQPLADRVFNRALQQRVRLFQKENGLADDGVVGVQTLLKLNEQLAIDITAAEARHTLQAIATEGLTQ